MYLLLLLAIDDIVFRVCFRYFRFLDHWQIEVYSLLRAFGEWRDCHISECCPILYNLIGLDFIQTVAFGTLALSSINSDWVWDQITTCLLHVEFFIGHFENRHDSSITTSLASLEHHLIELVWHLIQPRYSFLKHIQLRNERLCH